MIIKKNQFFRGMVLGLCILLCAHTLLAQDKRAADGNGNDVAGIESHELTMPEMDVLIKHHKIQNTWAIRPGKGDIEVAWAPDLLLLGQEMETVLMPGESLNPGVWWNIGTESAFFYINNLASTFELPPASFLVIDLLDLTEFRKAASRPVLLYGTARNTNEFNDLVLGNPNRVKIIRSHQEWQEFLAKATRAGSILHGVSAKALQTFSRSLVFNNRAVSSFDYAVLQEFVSYEVWSTLLKKFGMDGTSLWKIHNSISTDSDWLTGYECVSAGTCRELCSHACNGNCS